LYRRAGETTSAPLFRICSWISRGDFERIKRFADYLGRQRGCSMFTLKHGILSSPRLHEIVGFLERLGAEFDNETKSYLEELIEKNTTIYVELSREGFVLRSQMYLADLLTEHRRLGRVRYSREKGGFLVKPFALVDVVKDITSRGYRVVDRSGLLETGSIDVDFVGELRPYQQEAIEAWQSNNGRGLVVLPTGAGKTIVALAAISILKVPTLIVVYTKEQLNEWMEKIGRFLRGSFTVGAFYSERKDIKDITVATYQSAYRNIERLWNKFSLLIIDEAHHLPADKFRRIALEITAPYRLGLTATPYREDGRHNELFGLMGGIVYEKSLEELKRSGYVANFEVIPRLVSLRKGEYQKYKELKRKYSVFAKGRTVQELVAASASGDESARKALQALNEMRKLLALSEAKLEEAKKIINDEMLRGSKIIVFTQYVQQAEALGRALGVPVVTGRTDKVRRRIIMELFKKGRYRVLILTTVGDEGIDIPDANVGVVLSGTSSRRQFIQRLGRLLRPQPGKVARLYYVAVRGTQEEAALRKLLGALNTL